MTDILATIQQLLADGAKKDETIRELEAKIQKYEAILLNRGKSSENMFLIYKNDFGEDSIDIIGRNIREFGELLYHQGHKLIARQESNLEFCIYLASFDGNSNFDKSIKMIENLIEKKRTESENESFSVSSTKIVPDIKIITQKVADVDKNMEKMQDETKNVQQTLEEFKAQSDAKFKEMKINFEATFDILRFSAANRAFMVNKFYKQKSLEYIRNSPSILEKMCMRLSVKDDGDDSRADTPFKDILSMEDKKKELIQYFELLQKNLDGSTKKTQIQINIKDWMFNNWSQLVYKPTTTEKEEWKKDMEQKLKVKDTIGTVCYIPYKWDGIENYFFFCIANSKIIDWDCGLNKADVLKNVYNSLKSNLKLDTIAKFATDMEVSDDLSDYFVHVSTDKIMKTSNNQKVMEWMTNNFGFLKYSFNNLYQHSICAIYSLALKYFEESFE